ncbi:MAG: DUF362 domain-containing protein [Spirochaetales bacterium]|nr:DUF362 domain-containing protein [Spirochaetales bacterium]
MSAIVSLVRQDDYEPEAVAAACAEAFELAGFPDVRGRTVLLKPNILLGIAPEAAATTHPEVLRAAIRQVRARGAKHVLVGDSPGFQVGDQAFRATGLLQVAEAEGAEWVDFMDAARLEAPRGKALKSFNVARAALEADVLVSLAKLKNHTLMGYTGALKNLFGCVPGLQKPAFHLRFPDPAAFALMLNDLAQALEPDFALIDGIVGMEGPGPGSGYPRKVGALIASRDPLAADRTACRIVGIDPDSVPNLKDGLERRAWISSDAEIEVRGASLESLVVRDWKPAPRSPVSSLPSFLKNLATPRPWFDRARCIACGACLHICPAAALVLVDDARGATGRSVRVDHGACIRCYCCHEVCPADAITVRRLKPRGASRSVKGAGKGPAAPTG